MNANKRIYVIGDVHGQFEKLAQLLRDTKLVGNTLSWTGGNATLWFMGDFFDRGPGGIAVVDLVMRLQEEAAAAGGRVESLLGNHEVVLLAARRFGTRETTGPGGNFVADWVYNGGFDADLAGLTLQHMDWIINLPAMALAGDWLFVATRRRGMNSWENLVDAGSLAMSMPMVRRRLFSFCASLAGGDCFTATPQSVT